MVIASKFQFMNQSIIHYRSFLQSYAFSVTIQKSDGYYHWWYDRMSIYEKAAYSKVGAVYTVLNELLQIFCK